MHMQKEFLIPQWASIILLLTVNLGVFFAALSNGFVYDDINQIVNNTWIRDVSHIPDIFLSQAWSFEGRASNYYRPLAFLIYMIDYSLFGLDPWGYHLTSVLMHAGVSVLVFLLARFLMQSMYARNSHEMIVSSNGKVLLPLIAGILFATHPINSEPVMWVASLSDISFTLFYLLALYTYIKGRNSVNRVFAPAFFFIACLGKETALTLPVMLFAYDAVVRRNVELSAQGIMRLLKRYLPFIFVALVYFAMRTSAIGGLAPIQAYNLLSIHEYFINIFPLFGQYLGKLVVPIHLNVFHVFQPISSLLSFKGFVGVAATLCYVGACFRLARTNRILAFCLIWIAIPLLPALYIPALLGSTFAERYLYLPSVGFVLLVSITGALSIARFRELSVVMPLAIISLLMLVCLYTFGTVSRIPAWESNLTLWSDAVKTSPNAPTSHYNLASALFQEGQLNDAKNHFREAARLNPNSARAYHNLGFVYMEQGLLDNAEKEYKKAIQINPKFALAHHNLGVVYGLKKLFSLAIQEFEIALKLHPNDASIHFDLGVNYINMGKPEQAIHLLQKTLVLQPDHQGAKQLLWSLQEEIRTNPR